MVSCGWGLVRRPNQEQTLYEWGKVSSLFPCEGACQSGLCARKARFCPEKEDAENREEQRDC